METMEILNPDISPELQKILEFQEYVKEMGSLLLFDMLAIPKDLLGKSVEPSEHRKCLKRMGREVFNPDYIVIT